MNAPPRTRFAIGLSALSLAVGTLSLALTPAAPAMAIETGGVLISEIYGAGGNSGAIYDRDFIELHNTSASPVVIDGWTVQYTSTAGTTWTNSTPLSGTLAADGYALVGEAFGTTSPPRPALGAVDFNDDIALAAGAGKVALVRSSAPLTCGGSGCANATNVVDFVGYGTANDYPGVGTVGFGPAPAPNATNSTRRTAGVNNQNNSTDFTAGTPTPEGGDVTPTPIPDAGPLTIAQIQGTGDASTYAGSTATTRGVVTATYGTGGRDGFVIQTPGSGGGVVAGRTASEGLFIYSPTTAGLVTLGDYVEVSGVITEFNGLTELTVTSTADLTEILEPVVAPVPISDAWPATNAAREAIESMVFNPTGTYTVSNNFNTNNFGEVGLAFGTTPLIQPTDIADFGSPAAAAVTADNAARGVVLDDGATVDYLSAANRSLTPPYISLTDPVRVGARVVFSGTYIVDQFNATWRLQPPTQVLSTTPTANRTTFINDRTPAPDQTALGDGAIQVASFNVLNYFTTLGTDSATCTAFRDRDGDGVTVNGGCDQRGAWDNLDLGRQQAKIVSAVNALDASVVGLLEIENSAALGEATDEALGTLVAALNTAAGSTKWAFVPSSTELPASELQDVITNAIIYQPAEVTPLGVSHALGTQSAGTGAFSNAREPIGQAFIANVGGGRFFVAVNHFKSKSASSPPGTEPDTGQGNFNESRVAQATALRDWVPTVLATYPADTPVSDVFLVGDFNSYTQEDPLQVLYAAGYVDSNGLDGGEYEYSYSFSGLSGSLDHVLISSPTVPRVTGSDIWEINSPESIALEYSRFNYHGTSFYDTSPFRSSDHDPVIVGFDPVADVADYNPVGPLRVFDTRPGESPTALRVVPKAKVSGDPPLSVRFTDLGGVVPDSGVGAVSINVTVTGATVPGFVTVYSCGTRQLISSVNFAAGQTAANAVTTPVSEAGNVCFFSNTPVDIVVDINGWFASGAAFNAAGPSRVFDTRADNSPGALRAVPKQQISGSTTLAVKFTGLTGLVPETGVGTVSMNLTVTGATVPGFVTVYPCGQRTQVSSVNFAAGQTVANAVISRVSAAGEVCFFSNTPVDVIADVNGWFPLDEGFTSIEPQRLFDTRPGQSQNSLRDVAKVKVGGTTTLEVRANGLAGLIPAEGVSAVSLNVTVEGASVAGFVTVYPCGTPPPTSSVNFTAGQTVANAVIAPLSATGTVCFFSNTPVDIVVDINGYFDADVHPPTS